MAEPKEPKESKEPKRTIRQKVEAFAAGQQVQKLQAHWKAHQREYLIGGGCLVVGYLLRRPQAIAPVFNNSAAPVFNNDNSSSVVNFGGHMTKIVRRSSDGKTWLKVTEAAEEVGCSVSKMSRHLNGSKAHVNGELYSIVGIGTSG
jgi:hypothetical protein